MNKKAALALAPRRISALSRRVAGEVIVYDPNTHLAHCLNETAAAVWMACDGKTTVSDMVHSRQGRLREIDEEVIWAALSELRKAGLVEKDFALSNLPPFSRRKLIRKLAGFAGLALPVVTSIVVASSAQAASCFPLAHACSSNVECCSNHCGLNVLNVKVCLP